jgi:hypothetical protein
MKLSGGDGVAQERKATNQASGRDATIGFVLGGVQLVDAIRCLARRAHWMK